MRKRRAPGDGCVDSAADRAADIHAAVNGHLIDITPSQSGVSREFLIEGASASSLIAVWAQLSPQVLHQWM